MKSLKELHDALRLGEIHAEYQFPSAYQNVAEISRAYLWEDVLKAAQKLTDEELKRVISCSLKINFHNNATNGHSSMGASWTIAEFLNRQGSSELKERIKTLS